MGVFILAGWVCLSSWVFGFHISALNAPQRAITCRDSDGMLSSAALPPCLQLTLSEYGIVTSSYIFGGLISCILTSTSFTFLRPSSTLRARFSSCAAITFAGTLLQAGATGFSSLACARAITGFGAAGAISMVPPALGEIAPAHLKGSIGVLHQLGITLGILSAQAAGLVLSKPTIWRCVPLIAAAVSLIQILSAPAVNLQRPKDAAPTPSPNARDEEESLLTAGAGEAGPAVRAPEDEPSSLFEPGVRRGTLISLASQMIQQLSGVNAVIFYSTTLLTPLFPSQAPYLAFYLTIFNAAMTFPPIYLIRTLGPRRLLLLSIGAMGLASAELGFTLNNGQPWAAAAGVFLMIGSFALGLGPVPFLLPPLLSPAPLVTPLSSLSLLLNFVSNLTVGALFLPVRDALSTPVEGGKREGEGNVFYLFGGVLAVGGVALGRWWRA